LENFERQLIGDVLIEKVNLLKATLMNASIMKNKLFEDIQLNNQNIIVDVSKCILIVSAFLGELIVSLKRTRETGGEIKLVISTPSFTKGLLNISGILKVFENYISVEDALKSFRT